MQPTKRSRAVVVSLVLSACVSAAVVELTEILKFETSENRPGALHDRPRFQQNGLWGFENAPTALSRNQGNDE